MARRISFMNCRDDKNIAEAIAMEKEAVVAAKKAEIDAILHDHPEIGYVMREGKQVYYKYIGSPVFADHPAKLIGER